MVPNSWVVGGLHLRREQGCVTELETLWSLVGRREMFSICSWGRGTPAFVGRMRGGGEGPGGLWGVARHQE